MAVKRAKTSRSKQGNVGPSARKENGPSARKENGPSARKQNGRSPGKKKKSAAVVPRKTATRKAPVKTVRKSAAKPKASDVVRVVEGALDEMKAVNVKVLDVRKLTDIADTMIIASGNSDRHVRSIADRVIEHAKKAGFRPSGVEGERDGEWVLVDLQDAIVHIMLPRIRDFYRLENLWDVTAARREAAES